MQCGHSNALRMRSYRPGKATASKGKRESETEVVEGVESQSSASQSSIHPPQNLATTKTKGKCRRHKRSSKNKQANDKKANKKRNGSRVVVNHFLPVLLGLPNTRTCILDSLCAHIGHSSIKQAVISSFFKMMPTEATFGFELSTKGTKGMAYLKKLIFMTFPDLTTKDVYLNEDLEQRRS